MEDYCGHKAFFEEGLSFYQSAKIVQQSDYRIVHEDIDLFGPVVFLFRHAAELLFKAIIIRKLSQSGIADWQSYKSASSNRKITSTHSISELFDVWKELGGGTTGLPQDKQELFEWYISDINRFDEDSTFFRYPLDKHGNRNRKAMTDKIDVEMFYRLPCSLKALVLTEGADSLSCLHREQFMESLEYDLDDMISVLIELYQKENEKEQSG